MKQLLAKLVFSILERKGRKTLAKFDSDCQNAREVSNNLLLEILKNNSETEYGKLNDFASIKNFSDYQKKVPFSGYDTYAPYIARMMKGEDGLICNKTPVHYATTSGSIGVPKYIPVSKDGLDINSDYGFALFCAMLADYYKEQTGKKIPWNRGTVTVEMALKYTDTGVSIGAISSAMLFSVKKFLSLIYTSPMEVMMPTVADVNFDYLKLRYALCEPDLRFFIAPFMTAIVSIMSFFYKNWREVTEDIEKGTINPKFCSNQEIRAALLKNIKPMPERAESIRSEVQKGFDDTILKRLWKNLAVIGAIGTGGFAVYTKKVKKYAKDIPFSYIGYAASESLFAVDRHMGEGDFTLIPNGGFYEFLPADSETDDPLSTITIDKLEVGKDYEIILTNLSGFYRYRINDIVRVTGWEGQSPRLKFVYRKNQMISIAGEKTNDEAMSWAMEELSKQMTKNFITDYCVYANVSTSPGFYEIFIETNSPVEHTDLPKYRDILEEKLSIANPSFGAKIKTDVLKPTVLKVLQPETNLLYRELMIYKGINSNQIKPVRVIDTPFKEKFFFNLLQE